MDTTPEEYIVLVDEQGNVIGSAPKLASHHAKTPLHKAFSCYLFDTDGRVLVTRRARSKKVWPGVWTNSFCGHPAPDESDEDAIRRRGAFELGATVADIQVQLPDYRYKTPPFNGIVENEICPVYFATLKGDIAPNPEEVEEYRWMEWDKFLRDTKKRPDEYSYWTKDQLQHLAKQDL